MPGWQPLVDAVLMLAGAALLGGVWWRSRRRDRLALEALRASEERFRGLTALSADWFWETDADARLTWVSGGAPVLLILGSAPAYARRIWEIPGIEVDPAALAAKLERLGAEQSFFDLEIARRDERGARLIHIISGQARRDAAGRLLGYRGVGRDVTEQRGAERALEAAKERLELALECAGMAVWEYDPESDLMHLSAGWPRLLGRSPVPQTVRSGELFVNFHPEDRAAISAAYLATVKGERKSFYAEFRVLGHTGEWKWVACAGRVTRRREDGRAESVAGTVMDIDERKRAEQAMREAEAAGRALEAPPAAHVTRKQAEELGRALDRGELLLHYQPVIGRGRVVGAEALVRWNHPERGLLGPDEFIPAAEDCGLIGAFGDWTLKQLLRQVGAWRRRLPRELWFAFNVSAAELAAGEAYVEKLRYRMMASEVEGAQLELEVTERLLMSHMAENVKTLRRIGELGLRIAIDDFGAGYSSLAYLRRLPIDKLKIDRLFLHDLDSNRDAQVIVQAIAAMAKSLGLHVAAEGVENEAQLARLLALGCEEWQGHHFSPPLEAEAFERLVLQRAAVEP